jgi:hypothetical protein
MKLEMVDGWTPLQQYKMDHHITDLQPTGTNILTSNHSLQYTALCQTVGNKKITQREKKHIE